MYGWVGALLFTPIVSASTEVTHSRGSRSSGGSCLLLSNYCWDQKVSCRAIPSWEWCVSRLLHMLRQTCYQCFGLNFPSGSNLFKLTSTYNQWSLQTPFPRVVFLLCKRLWKDIWSRCCAMQHAACQLFTGIVMKALWQCLELRSRYSGLGYWFRSMFCNSSLDQHTTALSLLPKAQLLRLTKFFSWPLRLVFLMLWNHWEFQIPLARTQGLELGWVKVHRGYS